MRKKKVGEGKVRKGGGKGRGIIQRRGRGRRRRKKWEKMGEGERVVSE